MTTTDTGTSRESRLDRIGIPYPIRWGFLAVLVFMTGNGVESNFITPHLEKALGSQAAVVPTIIAMYGLAVLVGSYLAGALSDLFGPRRIMLAGFVIWIVFEVLVLIAVQTASAPAVFVFYFLRGFGYPLFAFSFLVWINHVVEPKRNGTAVGWFYVMFTGGLPTFGSVFAAIFIPVFGGGFAGESATMAASIALVVAGWLIAWFAVREEHGMRRLAPERESAGAVLSSGIRLTIREPKVLSGFLVRLINTAPEFGMFIILPTVIANDLGWGQTRWLIMTSFVYASNIAFNALFGWIGDRIGWVRTVRWFGVFGSALGLLIWWTVPHLVEPGSDWGYVLSVASGMVFGIMLAGFVPMGAVMPALVPEHKGAAMAMYTTAAGGAAFLGAAVVAVVQPWGGDLGAVLAFVVLYAVAFALTFVLKVKQQRLGHEADEQPAAPAG